MRNTIWLTLLLCLPAALLSAQTGAITGIVMGKSIAGEPGVKLTATNIATKSNSSVTSNSAGIFDLINLPVGDYTLTAEVQGFKRTVQGPFKIDESQTVRISLTLEVGDPSATVEIKPAKPEVQPEKAPVQVPPDLLPYEIPSRIALGMVQLERKDWANAMISANQVLNLRPDDVNARVIRGSALVGINQYNQARQELNDTLKLHSYSSEARYQLGYLDMLEKKLPDAEKNFRMIYDSNPPDYRGLMGLIEIYNTRNDIDGAVRLLKKEIALHAGRPELLILLGDVVSRSDKPDEAVAIYKQLLEKNPQDSTMNVRLGSAYRRQGDLKKAVEHLRRAIELDPNNAKAYSELGLLVHAQGNLNEARLMYEQLLKLQPYSLVALNNLAFLLADEGTDLDRALLLANRAAEASSNEPNVVDTIGWIYIKKNLPDKAITVFTELISKNPTHGNMITFQTHLGLAYALRGDKATARKTFEAALLLNPSDEVKQQIQGHLEKLK